MKAKILFFFSLFLFALFSLSAAPEGSAKAEFDRQTVRLAAKLQLHTFEEEFFRRFPARVETALAEDMKRHPQLHREKAKSFLLSGKMTAQEAEKQFIAGATERLSPYQLSSKELNSLLLPGREARKKHFDALFALLYEKSRQQALWEQRKAMLPVILPDGETVEKSSDEALKREIARRFAVQVDRKLLWEENERFFQNEMIPKIISTVREQQKTQLQLLSEKYEAEKALLERYGKDTEALTAEYIANLLGMTKDSIEEELSEIEGIEPVKIEPIEIDSSELDAFVEKLNKQMKLAEDITNSFNNAVVAGFSNGCQELMNQLMGLTEANPAAVFKALLDPLADMAVKAGEIIMAEGIATMAARSALLTFGVTGLGAVLAGAALVAVGSAAKAGLSALASHGATSAGAGSVSSASSSSATTQNVESSMTIYVTGRISGSDILISGSKTQEAWSR